MLIPALIILLLAGTFLYLVLYGLWNFVLKPLLGLDQDNNESPSYNEKDDPAIASILSSGFKYYQKLPQSSKPLFVARVREFMLSKEFIGRKGLVATDEMKIIISAAAIQVTFGLNKFRFDGFEKIFIYPKQFYSRKDNSYHIGEVNLAGAIVFSWEDFKTGFADANDNYNVGLHEMAHALRFDRFNNDEYDEFFVGYFEKFLAVGAAEFIRARSGDDAFLRKYAGVNNEEFFSVCVEYFFESSSQMKAKMPELYRHICILLNQDPSISYNSFEPVRQSLFKKNSDIVENLYYASSTSFNWALIPFIGGLVFLLYNYSSVLKGSLDFSSTLFPASVIVVYVAAGGLMMSTKFRKFNIYKKGFVITYPLNPVLKSKIIAYDNLISATLFQRAYEGMYGVIQSTDFLKIVYTNGVKIKSRVFSIAGISADDMVTVAAFLKRKNVMIKVSGTKWNYENISYAEKQVPKSF